jgi:hypothetical protein
VAFDAIVKPERTPLRARTEIHAPREEHLRGLHAPPPLR